MTLFLNGTWKVTHHPYQADIQDILAENFVPEGWLNANVPEEIHATLRRAGAIRGNTYDKREDEERWIEEKDWIYCKKFFVPATEKTESATLLFEGLDTFCEIYLNGEKLGDHQNMHTACRLEAAPRLRWGGQNTLVIRFFSPVAFVAKEDQSEIFSITTSERIFARKAQMNYSWDFCARCVTVGIWKPVSLIPHKTPEIDNYYLYTDSLKDGQAALGLETELRCFPGVQAEGCTVHACLSDGETEVWNWEGSPEEAKKSPSPSPNLACGGPVPTAKRSCTSSVCSCGRMGAAWMNGPNASASAPSRCCRSGRRTASPSNFPSTESPCSCGALTGCPSTPSIPTLPAGIMKFFCMTRLTAI